MTDTADNPLVSIIVRTKDRPKHLLRALGSIARQSYRPLEVVLVNDGGSDPDIPFIRESLRDISLQYIRHEKNAGRARAGNAGMEQARGEYAGFLDDDDELYCDHVMSLVTAILREGHRVVYSDARLFSQEFDPEMNLIREEDRGDFPSRDFSYDRLLIENFIPLMCLLFPRDLFLSLGGFDETLDLYEDWDLLIRFGAETTLQHVRKTTAQYNIWSTEQQITERARLSGETGTAYARIFQKHRQRMTHETIQALLRESHAERDRILHEKDAVIRGLTHEKEKIRAEKDQETEALRLRILEKDYRLAEIYNSLGWRFLSRYRNMKERYFPEGTGRRKFYDFARRGIHVVRNEGYGSLLQRIRRRFASEFLSRAPERTETTLTLKVRPLAMPAAENPLVSIVIPVFNKAVYTFNCLESVREQTGDIPYEIIIVDNASTDTTAEMLQEISNITVIRNAGNNGFVLACNQGGDASRGEYIVFLNNDTKVTDGWLQALLEVFEKIPDAGMAGAKLVYPDRKLQEAGGIVWRDASAWNFGRYDDPDRPEYNYLKETDYCSGACIIIRKELFRQVGMFDLSYAPAYYEDTDLAFAVRGAGYRVIYQPAAEIIHFEGVTAGTDLSQGMKRFQEVNRDRFRGKWKEVLDCDQMPPGREVFLARDRSQKRPVLLYIDHYVPTFDQDAGSYITMEYLKVLIGLGFKIIFWPDNLNRMQRYGETLQQMGIEVVYGRYVFRQYMRDYGKYIDIVFAARPSIAPGYIDDIRAFSQAKIFYVAHDLHFLREQRRAGISGDPRVAEQAESWRQKEIYLASRSDATLLFSPVEKDIFIREVPHARVDVLPWIQPLNQAGRHFRERKDILFIGGFAHTPNEDAVLWFAAEIFPLVKKEIPDARFIVVGSHPPEKVQRLNSEDVVITGFLEDVSPWFNGARVFVSPLRYGAGFKGKNLLAMSYGLPLVTTSIGAEGIQAADGEDILLADDASSFADAVIRVYRDEGLWNRLSRRSLELIQIHYSPEAGRRKVLDLVGDLAALVRRRGFSAVVPGKGVAQGDPVPEERSGPGPRPPYQGYCTVCGSFTAFERSGDNLRETFLCSFCGSNSRNRHLAKVLCRELAGKDMSSLSGLAAGFPECRVYEAQSTGAIHRVLGQFPGYVCSEFFEGIPAGGYKKGIRCENLEQLTFPDNSFDVVITQDVFEHIRDPWAAFREVYRVLKPSGLHVFTIPYHKDAKTVRRVLSEGERDIHVLPKEYHGDGVRDGLVYTDFGSDLPGYLDAAGFSTEVIWSNDDDSRDNHIYWNVVFASRKPQ